MRNVPTEMTDAWLAEDKTGERRPTARATIQSVNTVSYPYIDTTNARRPSGAFQTILFSQPADVVEIPGVLKVGWNRGVTQDVAECTLTLSNNEIIPIGQASPEADQYDDPGFLSPTRGTIWDEDPWGFVVNGWEELITPDRLIRTYEGYGSDPDVYPAEDANLKSSGVWIVDDVMMNAEGNIEVKMRDVGRLLIDEIVFPYYPIPGNHYPLTFATKVSKTKKVYKASGGSWKTPNVTSLDWSGKNYIGSGITTSDGTLFVDSTGVWSGNKPSYALNSDDYKVWISEGHSSTGAGAAKVWWQAHLKNKTTAIGGVRIKPVGGPYFVYISLFDSVQQKWIGTKKIPDSVGGTTQSRIPFVVMGSVTNDTETDIILSRAYKNISKVRVTFRPHSGQLGSDDLHPNRAGMRHISFYVAATKKSGSTYTTTLKITKGTRTYTDGNITDYTDAVKWLLGWAGFFWPPHSSNGDYQIVNDDRDREYTSYVGADSRIPIGRIWGDFMDAGTGPKVEMTPDQFDKQPLMTAVSNIRDILGFISFVDETGGFIWRMPNIWTPGNFMSPDDLEPYARSRTTDFITIDDATILAYNTTTSSRNLREAIFVGNTDGRYATLVGGYGRYIGVDFKRIAGYLDQNFESQDEVETMADLIATRQKFSYRKGSVTIPAYPAIQIDDQIRIFERTTNETFFHYIESINSDLDMTAGTWTYQLGTHWLGEEATGSWVIDTNSITTHLKAYLIQLGMI